MRVFQHKASGKTMFRLSRNDCLALRKFSKDMKWIKDPAEIPLAHVAFSASSAEAAACSGPCALIIRDHTSRSAGKPPAWSHLMHAATLGEIAGLCDARHEVLVALTTAYVMHVGKVREGAVDFRADPVEIKNYRDMKFPAVEKLWQEKADESPYACVHPAHLGKMMSVSAAAKTGAARLVSFGEDAPLLIRVQGESLFDVCLAAARDKKTSWACEESLDEPGERD